MLFRLIPSLYNIDLRRFLYVGRFIRNSQLLFDVCPEVVAYLEMLNISLCFNCETGCGVEMFFLIYFLNNDSFVLSCYLPSVSACERASLFGLSTLLPKTKKSSFHIAIVLNKDLNKGCECFVVTMFSSVETFLCCFLDILIKRKRFQPICRFRTIIIDLLKTDPDCRKQYRSHDWKHNAGHCGSMGGR